MSYSKNNPPWLATSSTATPSLQAQIGLANPMLSFQAAAAGQPPVFSQPQAPPPPNISLITQMAAAASVQQPPHTLYTQTVSYPAPRPIAYPQMQALHSQSQQMSPQMPPSMQVMPSVVSCPTVVQSNIMATQRAYHGTVTKIQGDVGFIDDEIFFHKSVVCKGSMPKVGEQVFVEASYASNTPFKWNASRVQLLTVPGKEQTLPFQSTQYNLYLYIHFPFPSPPPPPPPQQQPSPVTIPAATCLRRALVLLRLRMGATTGSAASDPVANPLTIANDPREDRRTGSETVAVTLPNRTGGAPADQHGRRSERNGSEEAIRLPLTHHTRIVVTRGVQRPSEAATTIVASCPATRPVAPFPRHRPRSDAALCLGTWCRSPRSPSGCRTPMCGS